MALSVRLAQRAAGMARITGFLDSSAGPLAQDQADSPPCLFEDDAGLGIVDHKSDALTGYEKIQQSMASYRLLGGGYALTRKKSSGRPVTEAVFLF